MGEKGFRILRLTIIAAALAVISHAGSGETFAATVTVNIGDNWFCDSSFTGQVCHTPINTGDTIMWNWVGIGMHSTTACSDATFSTCGTAQGWDSGIKTIGTFSNTFNTAGTFYYRCNFHPMTMRGTIDVVFQDSDSDGWSDAAETTIGTDPLDACADTTTPDDERGPGFGEPVPPWPPDLNDDRSVTGFDLNAIAGVIGQNVPPAPVRRDISLPPNGSVTGADLNAVASRIGKICTP